MSRLRKYGQVATSQNGLSFYSNIRKRKRKARVPFTPALRDALTRQHKTRQMEYKLALKDAQDAVKRRAVRLHETFGGYSAGYYTQEILQRGRLERSRRKASRWNAYLREELRLRNAALEPGQRKLTSSVVAKEISLAWNAMDDETKVRLTDPLMEELAASREELDTKPKIIPIHVRNDVSSTMAKITRELDALAARTGFETILFGVRSSADHHIAPLVHATSPKIPKFFDLVLKKPVVDLAISIDAFCLSGVDSVIGKLEKEDARVRKEVVALITQKLREITKNKVNRMQYKNFDEHITWKHGIEIRGWPLKTFENPSSIGAQVELEILLNSWKSGATYFRKMSGAEHTKWVESRTRPAPTPPNNEQQVFLPQHHTNPELAPATSPAGAGAASFIQFGLPADAQVTTTSNNVVWTLKRPRKTRSDKGKPRKEASQMPGVNVFSVEMS